MLLAKIPPEVFFAGAIGVLTFLLLRMSVRRFRRTKNDSPIARLPRPESSLSNARISTPNDVARWEVELHDQARALSAQLDSKMLALGHLTVSAARQADRLEKAVAAAEQLDARQLSTKQPDAEQFDIDYSPSHTP